MSRLTREAALWLAIALLAALPRFFNLATPLDRFEAAHALAWLDASRGGQIVLANPLFGAVQAALFGIFGPSDVVARVFAALSGVALCLAPIFLREHLGRTRALMFGVALALSPTLWFVSRTASGAMLAWTLALWAFAAWVGQRRLVALALLGALLACGVDTAAPALAVVVVALVHSGIVVPSRRMVLAACSAFLASATALMLRPLGLGDALNGFALWAQGVRGPEAMSFERLLMGLLTNEVLFVLTAAAGLIALLVTRRSAIRELPWLVWFALGLFVCALDRGRSAASLVPCVIGCVGLATVALDRLLAEATRNAHPAREGVVMALTFVLITYAGLGIRQYAAQGQGSWLLPVLIALLLILAIIAAGSLGLEYSTALRGTALGIVASLLLYTLGAGFQLNHARADNPAEPYRVEAVLPGMRALEDTVRTVSVRATGEPMGMTVQVPDDAPASLRWALRDQAIGSAVRGVPTEAVILAEQTRPTQGNYIGRAFELTSSATLNSVRCQPQGQGGLNCQTLAQWLAFRNGGEPSVARWSLWVRADVAERAGGK
jgi:hypothetical protein